MNQFILDLLTLENLAIVVVILLLAKIAWSIEKPNESSDIIIFPEYKRKPRFSIREKRDDKNSTKSDVLPSLPTELL